MKWKYIISSPDSFKSQINPFYEFLAVIYGKIYVAHWNSQDESLVVKQLDGLFAKKGRKKILKEEWELSCISHVLLLDRNIFSSNRDHSLMCLDECECKKYAKYIDPNLAIERWPKS